MLLARERLVIVKNLHLFTGHFRRLERALDTFFVGTVGEAKPAFAPRKRSLVHDRDVNQTSVFLPASRVNRANKLLRPQSRSLLESKVSQVYFDVRQVKGLD